MSIKYNNGYVMTFEAFESFLMEGKSVKGYVDNLITYMGMAESMKRAQEITKIKDAVVSKSLKTILQEFKKDSKKYDGLLFKLAEKVIKSTKIKATSKDRFVQSMATMHILAGVLQMTTASLLKEKQEITADSVLQSCTQVASDQKEAVSKLALQVFDSAVTEGTLFEKKKDKKKKKNKDVEEEPSNEKKPRSAAEDYWEAMHGGDWTDDEGFDTPSYM